MRKLLAALFIVIGLGTAVWTISLSLPSSSDEASATPVAMADPPGSTDAVRICIDWGSKGKSRDSGERSFSFSLFSVAANCE
jgi:hypothetical protein